MTTLTFNNASDVYSFGITLWEIFSRGTIPYSGQNNADVVDRVTQGIRPAVPLEAPVAFGHLMTGCLFLSPNLSNFLFLECWDPEPSARPSFHAIHAILSKNFDPNNIISWKDTESIINSQKFGSALPNQNSSQNGSQNSSQSAKSPNETVYGNVPLSIYSSMDSPEKLETEKQNHYSSFPSQKHYGGLKTATNSESEASEFSTQIAKGDPSQKGPIMPIYHNGENASPLLILRHENIHLKEQNVMLQQKLDDALNKLKKLSIEADPQ